MPGLERWTDIRQTVTQVNRNTKERSVWSRRGTGCSAVLWGVSVLQGAFLRKGDFVRDLKGG